MVLALQRVGGDLTGDLEFEASAFEVDEVLFEELAAPVRAGAGDEG